MTEHLQGHVHCKLEEQEIGRNDNERKVEKNQVTMPSTCKLVEKICNRLLSDNEDNFRITDIVSIYVTSDLQRRPCCLKFKHTFVSLQSQVLS